MILGQPHLVSMAPIERGLVLFYLLSDLTREGIKSLHSALRLSRRRFDLVVIWILPITNLFAA